MTHLDFSSAQLRDLITHHVGNKLRDERINLSNEQTTFEDETQDYLLKYFLQAVKAEEFYSFTHAVKLDLNEVFTVAENIFSNPKCFIESSQSIAKLLYEQSMHPKIKEGELNVAYFKNVVLDNELVDAIGIFKSETDVPFLKMKKGVSKFNIKHDFGFELKGVDKGCIIFNSENEKGYKILVIDNTNRSAEAQYWKDDFLCVRPIANEFHQTNEFLGLAKNFVTQHLEGEYEVTKTEKIELLNRSVDYFKTHDNFDKSEFEQTVFQHEKLIESFQNYDTAYRQEHDVEITSNFAISPQAVKKQARIFKSVLKLDKNFHIYIHGNTDLIEQGVEADGRKFYKIYFKEEL